MNEVINARRDELLLPLHDSYIEALSAVRALEADIPQPTNTQADKKLAYAILEVKSLPDRIEDSFSKLSKQAALRHQEYNFFRYFGRNINRSGHIPVLENVFAVLVFCGLVEAFMAAIVYSIEGKMDFIQGFGFGAVFSFCSISVGLAIGWAFRYACITRHDNFKVRRVRAFSWALIVALSVLLGGLILSGARTRSLGRSTDIWNFPELSLMATFADSLSVIFCAIAILASGFAIWKGANSLSDFIVGYTPIQKMANNVDLMGEDLAENFEELIENIRDKAIDAFEDDQLDPDIVQGFQSDRAEGLEQCERHNIAVRESELWLQDWYHAVIDIKPFPRTFATELPHLLIDIEEVEAKLAVPTIPSSTEDLLATLDKECQLATAACKEALMAYLNADKSPDSGEEGVSHA